MEPADGYEFEMVRRGDGSEIEVQVDVANFVQRRLLGIMNEFVAHAEISDQVEGPGGRIYTTDWLMGELGKLGLDALVWWWLEHPSRRKAAS